MNLYAMYLRKSRADIEAESRGELETLARHQKTLLELADKMNLHVIQIYKEIVSGETIAARPVMQELLEQVRKGIWAGVLVMEVERLARGDGIDQQIVLNTFKDGGTKIITPIKTYDPNDEFDEEYFEFGLFMSRREYKTINRRIQRGRIASVKEGKTINPIPAYGYSKVKIPNDKGYTLRPNEEADVVKFIFDSYIQGKGMSLIANELDKLKIKPRYRSIWSKSTINDILSNPVYIGKIRWSYRKEKKVKVNGELKRTREINKDYYYIDGIHPPIINEDTFYKAQEVKKNNSIKNTKSDLLLKNPLSGLIYCSKCGSLMTRLGTNVHTKYDVIRCPNKNCDNISAPIFLVERKLINELCEWLLDYEIEINRNFNNINDNCISIKQRSIKSITSELFQVEQQISKTYDLLERQIYTEQEFNLRKGELIQRKDDLNLTLAELDKQLKMDLNAPAIIGDYIPQNKKLLSEYRQINSAQKKNDILRLLVHRVEYLKASKNKKGQLDNDNFELVIMPKLP